MPRPEDSQWAVSVAQVASRAGQSKTIDAVFPAPEGIGDNVIGVEEGADVHVTGSFDSIVDGLIFTAHINAPVHAECTRCLKPITRDWSVDATAFFPYPSADSGKSGRHGSRDSRDSRGGHDSRGEVDIIAGEDESEDTYPLLDNGSFADLEALIRDTLVEALPLQPLCKPDCLGLCSQCGADLNEDPDHHHDVVDTRFASLAALKAQLEAQE